VLRACRILGSAIMLVVGVGVGVTGCSTAPDRKVDLLDSRLDWPCDRLIITWSVDAKQLQDIVAGDLMHKNVNGVVQLLLSIMHCAAPSTSEIKEEPLMFAHVTIPVSAESVPFIITEVPEDGWLSVWCVVADANSYPLFAELGYDVIAADISFVINRLGDDYSIESRLTLNGGEIIVVANSTGEPSPHEASNALIGSGIDFVSAFFGQEKAKRHASVSATIQIHGETPLSKFDLPEASTLAVIDRDLRSNRVFWRLPNSDTYCCRPLCDAIRSI